MTAEKKNGGKNRKAFYKLMNDAVYSDTMENWSKRIGARLSSNEKDYIKLTSKPNYMSQKLFDNDLIAILKSKVTLKLKKPAYVGICILDFSKDLRWDVPWRGKTRSFFVTFKSIKKHIFPKKIIIVLLVEQRL